MRPRMSRTAEDLRYGRPISAIQRGRSAMKGASTPRTTSASAVGPLPWSSAGPANLVAPGRGSAGGYAESPFLWVRDDNPGRDDSSSSHDWERADFVSSESNKK
eukprot:Skav202183  [mRNA]  locus=scaffold1204:125303:125614:+ [translate_table: standard]